MMLKNSFKLLIISLLAATTGVNAQEVKPITSKIYEAIVFLNKAQIKSKSTPTLADGMQQVLVQDLPVNLDPNTIQVKTSGNVEILSVQHRFNYEPKQEQTQIKSLEDTLQKLGFEKELVANKINSLAEEQTAIFENRKIGGTQDGLAVEELEELADFYRVRILNIKNSISETNRKLAKLDKQIISLTNQLNTIKASNNTAVSEILISLDVKKAGATLIDLSYVIMNAGWVPIYDIKFKDLNSPLAWVTKAKVFQMTGKDWSDINISLSTSDVSLNGQKPELYTWWVAPQLPQPVYKMAKSRAVMMNDAVGMSAPMEEMSYDKKADGSTLVEAKNIDYTSNSAPPVGLQYDIPYPISLKSDAMGQVFEIKRQDMPATYYFSCVPKLDKDVFLMAKIPSSIPISGEVNLFSKDVYLGKTLMDASQTSDSTLLSLGREKNISVNRKLTSDFTSRKLIGANKKEEYAYEIEVKNNRNSPIKLTIEDQVPVSTDNKLEIETLDYAPANFDVPTGKLIWNLNIPETQVKKLKYKFSLKYPKEMSIPNFAIY